MPLPLTFTVVAPDWKLVPVSVTVWLPVCAPVLGDTVVSVGAGGLMVKVCVPLVPPAVVTDTVRAPSEAPDAITRSAVSEVALATLTFVAVMLVPLTATVVAPLTKLVPVRVTVCVVPCTPVAGATLVNVGVGGFTVKVCAPLVPADVVAVTFVAPSAAPAAIVKSAVSVVALVTFTLLTVTPALLTATDVPPTTKFVPVSVTPLTVVPCTPTAGDTVASAGAVPVTVNGCA